MITSLGVFAFSVRLMTIVKLEDQAVDFIRSQAAATNEESELQRVIEITDAIGRFCVPRREFADHSASSRSDLFLSQSPILASLAYGGGACGYATEIGVRVFEREGFESRFVQVLDHNRQTRHVVMDVVLANGQQVVIDPIFGHIFLNEDLVPLDADELRESWETERIRLPNSKIRDYSYEHGIRFTNWDKNSLSQMTYFVMDFLPINREGICLRILHNRSRRWIPWLGFLLSAFGLSSIMVLNKSESEADEL